MANRIATPDSEVVFKRDMIRFAAKTEFAHVG